jgi:HlyD family secretion protein
VRGRLVLALSGAGLLLLGVGALYVGRLLAASNVPTLALRKQPYRVEVTAQGNLKSAVATPITAPTDVHERMTIAWIVEDGAPVKKGQLVARFDPSDFEKRLTEGREDEASAGHKVAKGKAQQDATDRNFTKDVDISEKELAHAKAFQSKDSEIFSRMDIIESAIDADLAEQKRQHAETKKDLKGKLSNTDLDLNGIERKKAGLKIQRAQAALGAIEIRAPHDGVMALERDWTGELPRVGQTVWPGMKLGEIPDTDAMEAEVFVLEADAGSLAKGQKAEVTLDAHPEKSFRAEVSKVDPLAKPIYSGVPVQYFTATLSLKKSDPAFMKPGQRVKATILLEDREAALVVPRQALFEREGKTVAFRKNFFGGFTAVPVTASPAMSGRVVVTEGLRQGDVVALLDPSESRREEAPKSGASGPSVGGSP